MGDLIKATPCKFYLGEITKDGFFQNRLMGSGCWFMPNDLKKIKDAIDATLDIYTALPDPEKNLTAFNNIYIRGQESAYKPIRTNELDKDQQTFIYVMFDSNTGYYKIGKSVKPEYRERTLQSEKPTIDLLFYYAGYDSYEAFLHKKFNHKRIRGEWFDLTDTDLKYIVSYLKRK